MQLIRAIVFIFLFMAGSLAVAQPNSPDQPIGKVIFATGDAYADQVKVQSGSPIHVGQALSTSAGGHLHVRMIDGAFLSLRPSSAVKVSLYTIDLEQPANNQIRIDVQYGVVRSVTGKGGEDNHAAFRLNTPVAAIGIRGTDFIVYTDAVSSVVDLRQGGIEMTPLSDTCSPYTLGACTDGQSVTLLERDPGLVAEVHAAQQKATRVSKASAPVVPDKVEPAHPVEDQSLKQAKDAPVVISTAPAAAVPVAESKATEATADSSKTATTDGKKSATTTPTTDSTTVKNSASGAETGKTTGVVDVANTSVNESQTTTTGTGKSASTSVTVKTSTGSTTLLSPATASSNMATTSAGATADVASIAPVTAEVGAKESVTSEIAGRVIAQATTEDSIKQVDKEVSLVKVPVTIPVVPPAVAAKAQPFYWGRWTSYAENAEQNIVRDPARNKQVFAANTVMLLASAESGVPSLPKAGVVNFRQDKAEAHVFTGGALNDASVSNSALAVNFDQNHFTTSMDVSSSSLARGTEHLRATGTLDTTTGSLRSTLTGSNMTVAGKVADGASHAAYIFNQDSTGIVGAINWAAQ